MLLALLTATLSLWPLTVSCQSVKASWFASWHASDYPVSKIPWNKYTHLIYSFATTTPSPSLLSLDSEDALDDFVKAAHKNGVKASLSIGGWGGSQYFSTNVGNEDNRTTFVNTVTSLVEKYNLDGLDFDWEYPAKQGTGCNTISPNDTSNFLAFLRDLRASPVGANLVLSAATSVLPWNDTSLSPSSDVSGFGHVLDWIAIMNYDMWTYESTSLAVSRGVGSVVGPNAPLDDSCESDTRRGVGSAQSALESWTKAGFPKEKIVLAVAGYGHAFLVSPSDAYSSNGSAAELASFPKFTPQSPKTHFGDKWDDPGPTLSPDSCGVVHPLSPSSVYNFWALVSSGFLSPSGAPLSGIDYRFDACSQTPYVYNRTSGIMVSYDDAASFSAKGGWIKDNGLLGFAMWETGGDYQDVLLDAITQGMTMETTKKAQMGGGSEGAAQRVSVKQWTIILGIVIGYVVR